jgi:hypothetical protein
MKSLIQDVRSPDRDLNSEPYEYLKLQIIIIIIIDPSRIRQRTICSRAEGLHCITLGRPSVQ